MTDLVKRLRQSSSSDYSCQGCMDTEREEAADRIEKDAQHIDEMYKLVAAMNADHTASKTSIDKLEAALRWIIEQERQTAHPTVCAIVKTARKALEGKDD